MRIVARRAARAKQGRVGDAWTAQRANRNTPRAEDNVSVLPDSPTVLSPPSMPMYFDSNAIVGQAARVHANAGPAVRVSSDSVNPPLQTLQSARVDSRVSANVRV